VIEEDDPAGEESRSRQKRKRVTKRQTTSSIDLTSLTQSAIGGKLPKKKFKEIIIDECDPDRLKVN